MLAIVVVAACADMVAATRGGDCPGPHRVCVGDGSLSITIGPSGIARLKAASSRHGWNPPSNYTLLSGAKTLLSSYGGSPTTCTASGTGNVRDVVAGKTVELTQMWSCSASGSQYTVTVVDTFTSAASSVKLTTKVTSSSAEAFTAELTSGLHFSSAGGVGGASDGTMSEVWLPWGKGCVQNSGSNVGMCLAGGKPWTSPLSPEPLPAVGTPKYYRFGAVGEMPGEPKSDDAFILPLVTVLDPSQGVGISLALSPDDPLLELRLTTSSTGAGFGRQLLRLGQGRAVHTSAHIYAHSASWRPALQTMTTLFAPYFEPWVDNAEDFEGLGSYSWNQEPYNQTRAKSLGFKTNWDLSGTWMPYDGLFLPYQDKWLNLGPINGGLAQYNVTYSMIDGYYQKIQAAGFHSLSYFDIGNWGTRTVFPYKGPKRSCGTRPTGQAAPCPDPDGGNAYLRDELADALLRHGWSLGGSFNKHKMDWVGTTDMDTMVSSFEDLIVEQCVRHNTKLKNFEGIAIDRLDYSEYFNYDQDDNTSWVPQEASGTWGKARALRLSYRHTFNRLHMECVHPGAEPPPSSPLQSPLDTVKSKGQAGSSKKKMMLNNCNTVCRLDEMRSFDGTFSEGAALNSVAWTGLRNPTILWTYSLEPNVAVLNNFFQQHLLMNVYPMAPMPKNDHSINPGDPVVEQAYLDYAPLFDLMHGARWLLSSDPAEIQNPNPTTSSATSSAYSLASSVHVEVPVRNPVSVQQCKAGAKDQQWNVSADGTGEIRLSGAGSTYEGVGTCLGLWCCGCKACCGAACTEPESGAQAAANSCHRTDKKPQDFNQEWVVSAVNGQVTEKKSGKELVATAIKAGASVVVASEVPTVQQAYGRLVKTSNGTFTVVGSNPALCLTASSPTKPPAPPAPPMTPEVNVFTLPTKSNPHTTLKSAKTAAVGILPPSLLIPIVLAGGHNSTILKLNLAPTVAELGWMVVSAVSAQAMHPGGASVKLGAATKVAIGKWEVEVPLVRGMAMVTAALS